MISWGQVDLFRELFSRTQSGEESSVTPLCFREHRALVTVSVVTRHGLCVICESLYHLSMISEWGHMPCLFRAAPQTNLTIRYEEYLTKRPGATILMQLACFPIPTLPLIAELLKASWSVGLGSKFWHFIH